MKPDTERKKFYSEKIHQKKSRMHVHLSKELRKKLKGKKRSLSLRKGDRVKIMRGSHKGKEGKVASVSVVGRKVYLEGITVKNARGNEKSIPFQPSNLLLMALESTKKRKELFSADAFKEKEPPKKEEKKVEKKAEEKPKPEKEEPPKPVIPTAREG